MCGTRHDFDPGMRDGNEWLAQIFIGKPYCLSMARAGAREGPSTSTLLLDRREFFVISHIEITAAPNNRTWTNDLYNSARPREMASFEVLFARAGTSA